MRITSNGNVGIGTVAPGYKLDTYTPNTLDAYLRVQRQGTTKPVGITLANDTVNTSYLYMPAGRNDLRFYTGGDRMTILNSNGNVGIGTTNPTGTFHVNRNDGSVIFEDGASGQAYFNIDFSNAGSPQIGMSDKGNDNAWAIGADDSDNSFKIAGGTLTSIPLITSNTKMTILANGNVGIGVTNPGAKLYVSGTGHFTKSVTVGTPTENSHAATKSYVDGAVSGVNANLLDNIDSPRFIFGSNGSGSNGASATQNVYELSQYKSGFWDVTGASWTPSTGWYWGATFAHQSN